MRLKGYHGRAELGLADEGEARDHECVYVCVGSVGGVRLVRGGRGEGGGAVQ